MWIHFHQLVKTVRIHPKNVLNSISYTQLSKISRSECAIIVCVFFGNLTMNVTATTKETREKKKWGEEIHVLFNELELGLQIYDKGLFTLIIIFFFFFQLLFFCPSIVSWVGLVRFAFNQEEEKNNNGRKSRMIHTMYSIYIRMRVWYRYWCWYCDTSIHISQVEGESEEEQSHSKNSDLLFLSQVLLFGSCVWAVFSFHHHFYFLIS